MGKEKREKHRIRNGVIISVIATLICGVGAEVFGYWPAILKALKEAGSSVVGFVAQSVSLPVWLLILVGLAPVLTFILIMRRLRASRPWRKYTEDVFNQMLWRWSYDKRGNFCCSLAFCPEDDTMLVWSQNRNFRSVSARCETCRKVFPLRGRNQQLTRESVERQIDRKIRTGEWKQAIAARMEDSGSK